MLLTHPIQPEEEILIRSEIESLLSALCALEDKYHNAMKNDEFLETKKKIRADIKIIQEKLKQLEILLNKTPA